MADPVILTVEGDVEALGEIEQELFDGYRRRYRIASVASPEAALDLLGRWAADEEPVALVLAAKALEGMSGEELLARVRPLHPQAKRALLIEWGDLGDREVGAALADAMARGQFDHYLLRPSSPPDERFSVSVSGFLLEWAEAQRIAPHTIHVVGDSWAGRAYELRHVLERCAMPHSFCLADSDRGREVLAQANAGDGPALPLVLFPNGEVLEDPTDEALAVASGTPLEPDGHDFDVVIVGAGPTGLSAAVYGASEGLSTLVVDSGGIGGQATSSSLIRNYLGFPLGISGGRLAQQAYEQAWILGARFAFFQEVLHLERAGADLALDLSVSGRVTARAVILATGASYRRIGIPELEALDGAGVFYGGSSSEAPGMAGRDVFIVGGANSAGQAALHLARWARRVTLVVRGTALELGMSHYLVREVRASPVIDVRLETEVVGGGGAEWLDHLVLRDRGSGDEETVAADGLFLMIGAHPHTAWLPDDVARDEQGFVLTGADAQASGGWPLEREPFPLETSMPNVLAAGDARHRSVKRVASAVGEGSVAVQILHSLLAEAAPADPR